MKRFLWALIISAGCFVALDRMFPPIVDPSDARYSTRVVDRHGEQLRLFTAGDGFYRMPVGIDRVSPLYLEALLHYEDRFFYYHPGVNPLALARALWQWISQGELVSGGSTLTMQVARILYQTEHSPLGKLEQMARAVQLEWHFTKREILELYLNRAPFSANIEGVEMAAQQYLRKSASELTASEAALLAVLPQAPTRYRPDRHPERAQAARDKVLDRLSRDRIWSDQVIHNAQLDTVFGWEPEIEITAPHFSRRAIELAGTMNGSEVVTTLDGLLQEGISAATTRYVRRLPSELSTAVVVINNQSREIIAYIGTGQFGHESSAGYINMAERVRSPGSALKPFIYASALDQGLIHSESLLADVPRSQSSYRPQNFHQSFSGPVAASVALSESLNVPFVQLIEAVGPTEFYAQLAHNGVFLRLNGGVPSSAIALGGAGITLEEVSRLFSALANRGTTAPLKFTSNQDQPSPRRLMSPEAAYITWATLTNAQRPAPFDRIPEFDNIGWKTGTSWGFRDAWSVGVSRDYTVGVWVGRPDNQPNTEMLGRLTAAPLMFDIFQMIDRRPEGIERPSDVITTRICWPDGRSEGTASACQESRLALTIGGQTPRTLDPDHPTAFFIAAPQQTPPTTNPCSPETLNESAGVWPRSLIPWLTEATKVSIAPTCLQRNTREQLLIGGIENGQRFVRSSIENQTHQLIAQTESRFVQWELNGEVLAENAPHIELALENLSLGEHQIRATDRLGRQARIRFVIQ